MDPLTTSALVSAGSSLLGGLFGGKKKGSGVQQQLPAFQTWPKEVQDMWLEKVVGAAPGVTTDREFQPIPMTRVGKPSTPFDSEQLYNWQQYSDQQGGMFSPMNPSAIKQEIPQIQMPGSGAGKTIAQYIPPAQKGGAAGFYLLSDGTKVGENDMLSYMAQAKPGFRGDLDGSRIIGEQYKPAGAAAQSTISPEIIAKIMQVLGGNNLNAK